MKRGVFFLLVGFVLLTVSTAVVSADCSDPSELIFGIESDKNAHGTLDDSYLVDICFENFFENSFTGSEDNLILLLSSDRNGLARDPDLGSTGYPSEVRYGDLVCEFRDDLCEGFDVNERKGALLVSLSGNTRAHMALGDWYAKREGGVSLCCASGSVDAICDYDLVCEDASGENAANCPYDCAAPITSVVSFDYQPSGSDTQNSWIGVPPEGTERSSWESGVAVYGANESDLDDHLSDVKKDFHIVLGSTLTSELNSISPGTYTATVHYGGSATNSSGPFDIVIDGVTKASGLTSNAGDPPQSVSFDFDIEEEGKIVEIDFVHVAGVDVIISGIEFGSYCGDGLPDNFLEECDSGDLSGVGKRYSGEIVNDVCIIDNSKGGLMCKNNDECGDGYRNSAEECDEGKHCSNGVRCQLDSECSGIGDGNCEVRDIGTCSSSCTTLVPSQECPPIIDFVDSNGNGITECSEINDYNGAMPSGGDLYLCETCSALHGVPVSQGETCLLDENIGCYGLVGSINGVDECRFEIVGDYSCSQDSQLTTQATVKKTGPGCNCPGGVNECESIETLPCPSVIRLPFFSTFSLIASVVVIGLIYLFYFKRRK